HGTVVYVGITDSPARRAGEHAESGRLTGDFKFEVVENDLTYAQARGYEQADIAKHNTRDTGRIGQPIEAGEPNRQWSYDPNRTDARATAFKQHEEARKQQHGSCT